MFKIMYHRYSLDDIKDEAQLMGVNLKPDDLPIIQKLLDINGLFYLSPLLAGIRCLQGEANTDKLEQVVD